MNNPDEMKKKPAAAGAGLVFPKQAYALLDGVSGNVDGTGVEDQPAFTVL